MYETILVPVDGSDASDEAVEHARVLARNHDSRVHVLHVVEYPEHASAVGPTVSVEPAVEAYEERGAELVSEAADRLEDAATDVESDVIEGLADETITEYAEDHDVDLIVMGTHGRTGLSRVLLGSTTERTLRRSTVPVLTVTPPEQE